MYKILEPIMVRMPLYSVTVKTGSGWTDMGQ